MYYVFILAGIYFCLKKKGRSAYTCCHHSFYNILPDRSDRTLHSPSPLPSRPHLIFVEMHRLLPSMPLNDAAPTGDGLLHERAKPKKKRKDWNKDATSFFFIDIDVAHCLQAFFFFGSKHFQRQITHPHREVFYFLFRILILIASEIWIWSGYRDPGGRENVKWNRRGFSIKAFDIFYRYRSQLKRIYDFKLTDFNFVYKYIVMYEIY